MIQDENGMTPLMYAARSGRTECAKILLKRGAQLLAKDLKGLTARNRNLCLHIGYINIFWLLIMFPDARPGPWSGAPCTRRPPPTGVTTCCTWRARLSPRCSRSSRNIRSRFYLTKL